MTVHFIGAGPGAPDLITVRGMRLIRASPVVLYAGSLVPEEILTWAAPDARVVDTASMTLDAIIDEMRDADAQGLGVARVHSGDPSLYGAIAEQMRRLDTLDIPYDITPGVPAYAAAAAALRQELTLPDVSQTVILTRTSMRSTPMPNREDLSTLASSGATLAIHLSARNARQVRDELLPKYGPDCPVAVVYRASWPDERVIRCTLSELHTRIQEGKIRRTALIIVGPVIGATAWRDSKLYDPEHFHLLRPKKKAKG